MKATQEQRQSQYLRTEELGKALQPPKAAFEASRDALSTLQEEDVSTFVKELRRGRFKPFRAGAALGGLRQWYSSFRGSLYGHDGRELYCRM